jgi:hypothetical protein
MLSILNGGGNTGIGINPANIQESDFDYLEEVILKVK